MRKVLVTGSTGVTGSALVRSLLAQGCAVTAVVRPGSRRRTLLPNHPALEVTECVLGDYSRLVRKQEYSAFFHLAWDGSHGAGKADLRNDMSLQLGNTAGVLDALAVCRDLNCPVFLAAGSQAEYGGGTGPVDEFTPCRPANGYGAAKSCAAVMASILAEQYGIRFIWARLFSVYGPRDGTYSMIDASLVQLLQGKSPAYTAGEQIWNYLYSADAAKALSLLAFTPAAQGIYCVASRKSRPLKEYIQELHTVVAPDCPPRLGVVSYHDSGARMDVDSSKLIRDTGFQEDYTFQRGVTEVRDWYLDTGGIGGRQMLL